jgi:ectoine hydroxylase-related dioxygenase (phytanoyl-CoA dioxygenase family)
MRLSEDFDGPGEDRPRYQVSAESLAHYAAHGFVVLNDVLTHRELEEMRRRIDGILVGRYYVRPGAFKVGNASSGGAEDRGRFTQQVMATAYPIEDLVLRAYGDHPRLQSIASQLMSTDHAGIFQQQALVKRPGEENPTPWHQDDFYFATDDPAVTAWIPLEPVSEENGTLRIVAGSHKGRVFGHAAAAGKSDFHEVQFSIAPDQCVPILPPPGGVSFHHKRTLHGAFPNRSTIRRIALAQHYSGGDVEFMRAKWREHKTL